MILCGIEGSINHGKSTITDAMVNEEPQTSKRFTSFQIIADVATAMHRSTNMIPSKSDINAINRWLESLPGILANQVHVKCSFDQIQINSQELNEHPELFDKLLIYLDRLKGNPDLLHDEINEANLEIYRPFLQWLGGYLVTKVNPGIWFEEILRRVQKAQDDGATICIIDGVRFVNDATLVREAGGIVLEIQRPSVKPIDPLDLTERELGSIQPDLVVLNNGTIEDLKKCARRIIDDLKTKHFKPSYETKNLIGA